MSAGGRQSEIISTKRTQHHNQLLSKFALQWSREYLLSLREQYQVSIVKRSNQAVLKEGDVVLLRNEGTAHCLWKLSRVTQLLQGRDGIVRAAKVQVLNTDKRLVMLRHPVQYWK